MESNGGRAMAALVGWMSRRSGLVGLQRSTVRLSGSQEEGKAEVGMEARDGAQVTSEEDKVWCARC